MDFRKLYKENPCFNNRLDNSKKTLLANRRSKRLENFNNNRNNLDLISPNVDEGNNVRQRKPNDRRALLLQWKEKKLKEVKNNVEMKKKPFVVGVIRHNVGSPLFKDISNTGKVTRNKEKNKGIIAPLKINSLVKQFPFKATTGSQFKFKVQPSLKKLTIPQSPNFLSAKKKQSHEKKSNLVSKMETDNKKENAIHESRALRSRTCRVRLVTDEPTEKLNQVVPVNNIHNGLMGGSITKVNPFDFFDVTAINPVKTDTMDLQNEENVQLCSRIQITSQEGLSRTPSPTKECESTEPVEFVISPFVAIGRGKQRYSGNIRRPEDSAKKEGLQRNSKCFSSSFTKQENESEEISAGVPYYSKLDEETQRIIARCDSWSKLVLTHHNIPKEIKDEIDSVVGQSRLLVKDKFQQFRSLVDRFECKTDPPVTMNDLDGFWDMMYIQVEGLKERFIKLDTLKDNGWRQVLAENIAKPNGNNQMKKVVKSKAVKPQKVHGNFRKFLKEMKKKDKPFEVPLSPEEKNLANVNVPSQTEEIKSPDNFGTPRKSATSENLLRRVLSSSVHEKLNSSASSAFRVLRTSLIGKELGTSPVKIINESCEISSPANRSILRKSPLNANERMKKKVLFGDSNFIALCDEDSCEDVNNTTFSIENDMDEQNQHNRESNSFSIMEEEAVFHKTLCNNYVDQLELPSVSQLEESRDIKKSKKQTRKRTVATPDVCFTPRRSTRLIEKSGLMTPTTSLGLQQSTRSRKKGTPHPKKCFED